MNTWGSVEKGSLVVRGGSWNNDNNNNFRCAYRNNNNPENRNNNYGFRVASTLQCQSSGCQGSRGRACKVQTGSWLRRRISKRGGAAGSRPLRTSPRPTPIEHAMKRQGNLFARICSFDNLLRAARLARRNKRFKPEPMRFQMQLEPNLFELQAELVAGTYCPGAYRAFRIRDPKPRLISAAPFRDRVVHHALCQVIEPIFDRRFIFDSYANRLGKGTHAALDRCTRYCRSARYVLKCDVQKYFPSIDHQMLLGLLSRKIKCQPTVGLLATIIAASNPLEPVLRYYPGDELFTPVTRRHGIPIGNLTSQFFGNVMLDPLDHWLKEELRCKRYLRYMDDFLVFGDDKAELHGLRERIRVYLQDFRLSLHPRKCVVVRTADGVPFLGWQVFPDHRRLRRPTGVRFQRRLRQLQQQYQNGEIEFEKVRQSLASWVGHLKHGDTHGLRRSLLESIVWKGPA
jgi:retron-type reverse transcriptase